MRSTEMFFLLPRQCANPSSGHPRQKAPSSVLPSARRPGIWFRPQRALRLQALSGLRMTAFNWSLMRQKKKQTPPCLWLSDRGWVCITKVAFFWCQNNIQSFDTKVREHSLFFFFCWKGCYSLKCQQREFACLGLLHWTLSLYSLPQVNTLSPGWFSRASLVCTCHVVPLVHSAWHPVAQDQTLWRSKDLGDSYQILFLFAFPPFESTLLTLLTRAIHTVPHGPLAFPFLINVVARPR